MLLPTKHTRFAESLIGLSSFVLENLDLPKNVDYLWKQYERAKDEDYLGFHSFDNLVLSIDLLYALGIVETQKDGRLCKKII